MLIRGACATRALTALTAVQGKEPVKPEFTVKLDPSKKPKAIDATPLAGAFKGKTVLGIYQLEGEELRICLPKQGDKERPSDFKSPEGSDRALMTFRGGYWCLAAHNAVGLAGESPAVGIDCLPT